MLREIPPDYLKAIRWEAARLARRTPWRCERDDLEQEGALAVWKAMIAGYPVDQAYARITARNAMSRAVRSRIQEGDALKTGLELGEFVADRQPDLDAVLDVREVLTRLKLGAAASTYDHLGETPTELAGGLGITRRAATLRLFRARKNAREALGEGYEHLSRKVAVKYSRWARFECGEKRKARRRKNP